MSPADQAAITSLRQALSLKVRTEAMQRLMRFDVVSREADCRLPIDAAGNWFPWILMPADDPRLRLPLRLTA